MIRTLAIVTVLLAWTGIRVEAQQYPTAPVHLVVPSAAGGSIDVVARMFAGFLAPRLQQPVVVDNKAGAETLIGNQFVARAAPDGHTLLFTSANSALRVTVKNPGVNVAADFAFISTVLRTPEILAVSSARPFRTVADLVDYARANPGKLNFASYGKTLWLFTEILNRRGGISAVHVPFSSAPQAAQAVAAGEVDYFLSVPSTLKPLVDAGRIRLLAVTLRNRSAELPDVPSLTEAGLAGDELVTWMGLMAPIGTAAGIVARLNAEVRAFLSLPETVARLNAIGFEPFATTPDAFRSFFLREEALLMETGAALGIEPQ